MSERQNIQELTLEEVMGDRFGRYSKYIIQDRALPDIRDGLKPVQRRILYSMNKDGNTNDKAFRKSAKSVGNIMGNYHPHGDSSIYEAMVRMSQDWKLREPLIEMHGNNGSMDGDPPAAMRYTEARLSKVSEQLLTDIEKETVDFIWNFDDTEKEPTVLPAKYPNLLVNGSTGISAGYATEIPTHNLGEVIDGTIYLIDHPTASLDKLMEFIPGPDFPTGGILQGKKELKKAYETGKGKVNLRSITSIEPLKAGREQIIVTELPYEVNKANLVKKIDELRLTKRIEGISEVRDESDRTGLRVVIELKKDVDANGILNYLLKNTDLQINYNFNMVAIHKLRPEQVGLKVVLQAYVEHRKKVISARSKFELNKAMKRLHLVSGLIKALSILDEVIVAIRASKDKKNAKQNLITQFAFSEEQAEAIVSLQLYRLTNTDIVALEAEAAELTSAIEKLKLILDNEIELFKVMKSELREVKKQFQTPRLTQLEDEIEEITIETAVLIPQEEVMVSITREGYIKRSSLRSYNASKEDKIEMKDTDGLLFSEQLNTHDHLYLLTTKGSVIYRPVHELVDKRWKEVGDHLSLAISNLASDEQILKVLTFKSEVELSGQLVIMTKNGMIKQTDLKEFEPWRTYRSRSTMMIKLKKEDEVIAVYQKETDEKRDVLLVSNRAFGLLYALEEVPIVGAKAAGVKSMNLKEGDFIVSGFVFKRGAKETLTVLTQRGAIKRMDVGQLSKLSRAKRGLMVLRELKTNPHRVHTSFLGSETESFEVVTENEKSYSVMIKEIPINDRASNGSYLIDEKEDGDIYLVIK